MPDKPLHISTAFPSIDWDEIIDKNVPRIELYDELEISGQQIAGVKITKRTIRLELMNGSIMAFEVDASGDLGPMQILEK